MEHVADGDQYGVHPGHRSSVCNCARRGPRDDEEQHRCLPPMRPMGPPSAVWPLVIVGNVVASQTLAGVVAAERTGNAAVGEHDGRDEDEHRDDGQSSPALAAVVEPAQAVVDGAMRQTQHAVGETLLCGDGEGLPQL